MAPLPSVALSVRLLVYVPAASAVEVIVTVKVAVPLLAIVIGPVIASQPLSLALTEGVIVMLPAQLPVALIVKLLVLAAGLLPTLAVKVSEVDDGVCKVHGGKTVRVTAICTIPTDWLVTLSTALMFTVPLYVPALKPVRLACTLRLVLAGGVNEPAVVVLSQEPPLGVITEAVLVQFRVFGQSPLLLRVAFW